MARTGAPSGPGRAAKRRLSAMSRLQGGSPAPSAGDLRQEAAALSRYLAGDGVPASALALYEEGCRRLFAGAARAEDDPGLLAFGVRHPWSLPLLDAACGLLRPRCSLRQRLFLMLAVLETTPQLAGMFLPSEARRPRVRVAAGVAARGAGALLKAAAGALLLPIARRG